MHVIFVRARSITGIITENISCLFRKFADPTRMFSSEIQLRFSEIYVSMSNLNRTKPTYWCYGSRRTQFTARSKSPTGLSYCTFCNESHEPCGSIISQLARTRPYCRLSDVGSVRYSTVVLRYRTVLV